MAERTKALTAAELEQVNAVSSRRAASVSRELARAAILAGDGKLDEREAARQCRGCFYERRRIVGRAVTSWTCQLCGAPGEHSNTGVPRVCASCSDGYDLCTQCGGDMDMQHRTKREARRTKRRAG